MNGFGKEVKFICTPGIESTFSPNEMGNYIILLLTIWNNYPIIGIHVFENTVEDNQLKLTVVAEGIDINQQEEVYHEVYREDSIAIRKFWCITEDHGDFILATLLLPEEY